MAGERRSYIVLRFDGLILHTVPLERYEAEWLYDAYESVRDRSLRARYLAEWADVLDAGERRWRQRLYHPDRDLYLYLRGVYEGPEGLERVALEALGGEDLPPEARQALGELLDAVRELYRRPVEPRPLGPRPARYYEMGRPHIEFRYGGWWPPTTREEAVDPRPEWYAYVRHLAGAAYGVSVFRDEVWLWAQAKYTRAVRVRRDVDDGDVVAALASDEAAREFLRENAERLSHLISELENELKRRGYADVARKAKVALGAAALLSAGSREEDALPA